MSERYGHADAAINPDQFEAYTNGVRVQEIEPVFIDDPKSAIWRQATPAVCTLDALRAQELAFDLMTVAELAEPGERAR